MDVGKQVLSGIVELDESWIGGLEKNKHADKKLHGHWQDGKVPMFGIREHHTGRVVMFPLPDTKKSTLEAVIKRHVAPSSTIYTDGHQGYKDIDKLGLAFIDEYVVHDVGEYVRGMATTNGIESCWSVLDKAYTRIFCYISPKHLARYANETAYRLSAGPGNGLKEIAAVLRNMRGKRLKWKDLIADPEK